MDPLKLSIFVENYRQHVGDLDEHHHWEPDVSCKVCHIRRRHQLFGTSSSEWANLTNIAESTEIGRSLRVRGLRTIFQ